MAAPPLTELDKALAAFFNDSDSEEHRARFYELFLNSSFFVPIVPAGDTAEDEQKGDGVVPLVVEADNTDYLVLFDTLERLQIWADDDAPYVPVAGYVLAEQSTPPLHWALNVGTDYSKTFLPDEIAWLAEVVRNSQKEESSH
ncbi:MAG: SseB family protein [Desulfuromonadaceae bacterium]|nr:SseB family protein [Desulfuromonadaceae bacterium]